MSERFIERGLDVLVQAVTGGRFGVEENPVFTGEWEKILAEKRNLATRIYDSGTLFIVDDPNRRIISRFVVRRK